MHVWCASGAAGTGDCHREAGARQCPRKRAGYGHIIFDYQKPHVSWFPFTSLDFDCPAREFEGVLPEALG